MNEEIKKVQSIFLRLELIGSQIHPDPLWEWINKESMIYIDDIKDIPTLSNELEIIFFNLPDNAKKIYFIKLKEKLEALLEPYYRCEYLEYSSGTEANREKEEERMINPHNEDPELYAVWDNKLSPRLLFVRKILLIQEQVEKWLFHVKEVNSSKVEDELKSNRKVHKIEPKYRFLILKLLGFTDHYIFKPSSELTLNERAKLLSKIIGLNDRDCKDLLNNVMIYDEDKKNSIEDYVNELLIKSKRK